MSILSQIIAYAPNKIDTEKKAKTLLLAEVPRSEMDNFNTPDLDQGADSILRPGETLEDFDVEFRRPNAQGGRIPFAGGTDAKTGMGFQKGNKYGKALKGKPSLNVTGKNQYTPKTTKEIQAIIDANPDYITPKNFYEPTEAMKQKGKKKLLTLTDTQNPDVVFKRKGYPPLDLEKITTTDKKRTEAKTRLEGRSLQLKSPKGYQVHHIMPLAGGEDLRTGDYAIVSKKMNAKMSKYNTKINKLVNEAYDLDYSKTESLKKLKDINNKLFDILKTVKKDLPKKYKGLLGFNKLTPVLDTFDAKGKQVFNAEPQGIDYKKSIAGSRGNKVRDTKKSVMQSMADNAPKFSSNPFFDPSLMGKVISDIGKGINVGLGPTGMIALTKYLEPEGGYDLSKTGDRLGFEAEAALAKPLVSGAVSVTDKIKNPMLRKIAERAALAGMSPTMALKVASRLSPVGIASLAGEAVYKLGKLGYEDQKRFNALSPEEQTAERAEQEKFAFDVEGS